MNKLIAFIGLVLVILSMDLFLYNKGLVNGKENYRHSKNFQLTLDSQYRFGLLDGKTIGYISGYNKGGEDCKAEFLKLSRKAKAKWCK